MTIYNKPDLKVFGSNAKPTEIAEFKDLQRGWGVTIDSTNGIPPMEWFNFLQNRTDKGINYLLQNGVTEWDERLEYPLNAIVKKEGELYKCIRQHTNKPLLNSTYWQKLINQASTNQSGIVALSSSVTSTDETKASTPKATKTAFDKAVQADNNANERLHTDGSNYMKGRLLVDYGDYSGIELNNASNNKIRLESMPLSDERMLNIAYKTPSGEENAFKVGLLKKSGTIALLSDIPKEKKWVKVWSGRNSTATLEIGDRENGAEILVEFENRYADLTGTLSTIIPLSNNQYVNIWNNYSGGYLVFRRYRSSFGIDSKNLGNITSVYIKY